MKYDLLLFDADDTLLDFKRSEFASFQIILEKNGIEGDIKNLHASYKIINTQLWDQYAEGLISQDFLKVERFRKFLETNNLKGDPSQLCDDYLETLPSQVFLIDGAIQLLETLHGKMPLVIVTNGISEVQHKRLSNSGLKPFIELIIISDECGFTKPDPRIFDHTLEQLNRSLESSRTLMIGDKLETDILGAQNFKIDSCWFNPEKKPNSTSIAPTYEIENMIDLLKILVI